MTIDSFSDSVVIAAPPDAVYDVVSDVTRVGEWSPICHACEWEGDGGPRVGATFVGHNRAGRYEWSTTSTVVVADPGREFAWEVNDGLVRWGYVLEPVEGGTRLTESWEFRDAARAMFESHYGDKAQIVIDRRRADAREGIPATLAAIKGIVEH